MRLRSLLFVPGDRPDRMEKALSAGAAVLENLRLEHGPIIFDVTLNGFVRGRNLLKTAFEPPFLSATLCAVLAALR